MIIAVSSAPNLDKSVLMAHLASKFGVSQIQHDPAREQCKEYGFQTLYDMPADLQRHVRENLLTSHLEFLHNTEDALLDYSIVEWLADWMRWFWSGTPTQSWAKTLELGREVVCIYGAIYHINQAAPQGYDGYAWLDTDNGQQIDGLIKYLYRELGVDAKVRYEGEV